MTRRGKIRAVVTDLDGTIVRADGAISASTVAAVRRLSAAGIPLIAATARTPAGLAVLEPVRRDVALAVCCNGALGYDPATDTSIWQHTFDPEVLGAIVAALARQLPDVGIGAYDGGEWALNAAYFSARGKWPSGRHRLAAAHEITQVKACAMGICHPWLTAAEMMSIVRDAGLDDQRAVFSYGASDVLDVAPSGVDKGSGVAHALALLNVPQNDTIGFGDAPNDLPMFDLVGVGIAVANAHADIIAAADLVTTTVDNDGFAVALEKLGVIGPIEPNPSSSPDHV